MDPSGNYALLKEDQSSHRPGGRALSKDIIIIVGVALKRNKEMMK